MSAPPLFRVGLLVTLRCNAECRHCFFNAGPDRKETISEALGFKIIEEAATLGAQWISLTGGEPLLEPQLCHTLVKHAAKLGLHTEIVSNGFWGETSESATGLLSPLREAGLEVLNLSLDDYHAEYIPIERVRNAYDSALALGIKPVIMVTTGENPQITSEIVSEILGDGNIQVMGEPRKTSPNALLIETPMTPSGRGSMLTPPMIEFTELKCGDPLRDIGVMPDGDVLPCCGPLGIEANVILGNLRDESLGVILEKASRDPWFNTIHEGVEISGSYSNRCHACINWGRKPFRAQWRPISRLE